MQNKKVIRISEKKAGTFTIIPNSILHNKKLKDFDKILLFSILSDSDTHFTFNQATYMKRFDCGRKRISNAIERLTIEGYVKHENIGFNNWQYIISEYGNLNNQDTIHNELSTESLTNDLSIKSTSELILVESIDIDKIAVQIAEQMNDVIMKHFPSIPQDIFEKEFINLLNEIELGKIKVKDVTDEKITNLISQVYTEPVSTKISINKCETIILNKMAGGTQNQRNDTLKKVKQWFIDNNCIATEEEIQHQTFKTHHNSKTSGRIIDPRYQD
ncbi:hypothetical protein [Flavobacterium sp.]|uniref:hypothetical protein n=1 Tax=Flavobacterium sp. TaxID=239 RepID=UPI002ED8AA52